MDFVVTEKTTTVTTTTVFDPVTLPDTVAIDESLILPPICVRDDDELCEFPLLPSAADAARVKQEMMEEDDETSLDVPPAYLLPS